VFPRNAFSVYGNTVPKFIYGISGARNRDQFTVTLSSYAGDKNWVGRYKVKAQVGGAAVQNYTITVSPATLHITPAVLTVVPEDCYALVGSVFCYNSDSSGWMLTGFVKGDSREGISGFPIFRWSATNRSPAGTYKVISMPWSLSAHNYTFKYGTGVLNLFAPIDLGSVKTGSTASGEVRFKYGLSNPVSGLAVRTIGTPAGVFNHAVLTKGKVYYVGSFNFTPPQAGNYTGKLQILGYPYNKPLIGIPISGKGVAP